MTIRTRIGLGAGIVLLALATAGVYVAAQDGPPMGRRGRPGRMGPGGPGGPGGPAGLAAEVLGRLNLSDAQKGQVKSIMDAHQDEMKALGDRAMAAHEALQTAISTDPIDDGIIRAKAADVGVVEADMAVARAHIRAELLQILTPEQQAQAKAMQGKIKDKDRMQQMRQRRGPQGPPPQ